MQKPWIPLMQTIVWSNNNPIHCIVLNQSIFFLSESELKTFRLKMDTNVFALPHHCRMYVFIYATIHTIGYSLHSFIINRCVLVIIEIIMDLSNKIHHLRRGWHLSMSRTGVHVVEWCVYTIHMNNTWINDIRSTIRITYIIIYNNTFDEYIYGMRVYM